MTAGPSWNGSAASRAPRRGRRKARPSSPGTSSRRPRWPSTTSPAARVTRPPTARSSAWVEGLYQPEAQAREGLPSLALRAGKETAVVESWKRKLRMGMVGGGEGAFIGAVHRIAATLDQQVELVAGCFSRNPENTQRTRRPL